MQSHAGHPDPIITYAITAVVIAVVFAIRWRRMSRCSSAGRSGGSAAG